jgi:hypothetical protein
MEGSPPGRPADRNLPRQASPGHDEGAEDQLGATGAQRMETLMLPDVIMAILDSQSRFPLAASAALIREHDGEDVFIYVVLLDDERQPISVEPGTITAVTYVTRHLGEDILTAFGDKQVIIVK